MFIASKKDAADYAAALPPRAGESLSVSPGADPPAGLLDILEGSGSSIDLSLPLGSNPEQTPIAEDPASVRPDANSNNEPNQATAPTPTPGSILNLPLPTLGILPGATLAPNTPTPPAATSPVAPTPTVVVPSVTPTTTSQPAGSNTVLATDYASLSEALGVLEEGQTLVVPAGEYRVKGPVYPPGNTALRFESGSLVRFLGSDDGFVLDGVSNVTIEGMRSYHESTTTTGRNIRTIDASNITLIDIHIERSGSIGISIDESHDILIDGYVNRDEAVHPGNVDDALNIRNSHSVRVRNFDLWVADDAISLKTMGNLSGQTYNVTIENGVIRSRDAGITFGSEIDERIHDVTIRNVEFIDSGNPIYFKRYDESYPGRVENIRIDNISASGSGIQRFFFVHGKSGTSNTVRDVRMRDSDFQGETEFQDFYFQSNDPETNGIFFENVTANGEPVQP